jgi:branched-chain amino acid transport system permease protein
MARLLDLVLPAVLLAGLYATMVYGLGLIYGVLRVVNLAHGGVLMAGAYLGFFLHERFGIDPYVSLPVVLAASFALGVVLYQGLVRRLPRGAAGGPASLLLLFGCGWCCATRRPDLHRQRSDDRTAYATSSVAVLGSHVAVNRLVVLGIAVLIAVAMHLLLRHTQVGRAIRAVAQNADSCTLAGIDVYRIYTLSFGLGTALAGVAGGLLATIFTFSPNSGSSELLKSFVVVVLGGLGSIHGVVLAALIVAMVEVFAILILPAYLTIAVGFLLLVVVLVVRPGGLFGHRVLS